jgi:hypothetical protein
MIWDVISGAAIFSPAIAPRIMSNIFAKLQVADRAGAILKVREAGLK